MEQNFEQAALALRAVLKERPQVGVILGSGLGAVSYTHLRAHET